MAISTPIGAVRAVFFVFGTVLGLWSGAVPTVAAAAHVSPAQLGIGFTLFIVGYLAAMSFAGVIARRISLRCILLVSVPTLGATLVGLFFARDPLWFMIALTVMGIFAGTVDLIMNAEGVAVEHDQRRPVLAGLHAMASGGIAVSAIPSSLLVTTLGPWSISALAVVLHLAAVVLVWRGTPERPHDGGRTMTRVAGSSRFSWVLVAIGLVAGISMAGELAAIMWSSSLLATEAPRLAAIAGTGAAFFAGFQWSIRVVADRLRARLGDARLVNVSLVVAISGFGIVAYGAGFWPSVVGFALIGMGTASIVPCSFALAVTSSGLAASAALAVVTLVTALPRAPMPALFGVAVERFSFALAFGGFTLLFAVALAISIAMGAKARSARGPRLN